AAQKWPPCRRRPAGSHPPGWLALPERADRRRVSAANTAPHRSARSIPTDACGGSSFDHPHVAQTEMFTDAVWIGGGDLDLQFADAGDIDVESAHSVTARD